MPCHVLGGEREGERWKSARLNVIILQLISQYHFILLCRKILSKSLSLSNSFWRSLFWFWFRFFFNSFWRSIFILVSVFILFYFILLCHKILSSLSLSLILFDTRSLFWFCFRFTRAYSNISLFYSITKYSSLSNSFWRSIFILVSFLLYLTLFYFVTKYLICFDYYHKVYSNITLFYFYKISKFL